MPAGFAYLAAILDVFSRRVLAWRLSNTLDARFCIEALQEALTLFGKPEVFNTDQGSQFTSGDFVRALEVAGVKISMDGRGRWIDNVFIERFWRSVKYEDVYLHAYGDLVTARAGIGRYVEYYNGKRRHSSLGRNTPNAVYAGSRGMIPVACHVRSGVLTTVNAASAHLSKDGQLSKTMGPGLPTWWHFDILRALDYLRDAGVGPDERVTEATSIVAAQQDSDGRWRLDMQYEGVMPVDLGERVGEPSRWITLRAARVLAWAAGLRLGSSRSEPCNHEV
jgi:hypothetical protein